MRVVVLVNPWSGSAAGGGGDRLGEIRRAFEEAGVEAEVCEVPGEQCENAARSAAGKGWDAIVAAGGDGTINTVASALVGSDMPMGILPLGTLNHFARDLGLPQDLAGAVGVIAAGKTRRVDVGQVNGWTFVNNSSMGLYPHAVVYRDQQRERLGRGRRSPPGAAVSQTTTTSFASIRTNWRWTCARGTASVSCRCGRRGMCA